MYGNFLLNYSDKFVEEIETHILWSITLFFPENRVIYEIVWIAGQGTDDITAYEIWMPDD
jgi:hypothetical protein